MDRQKIFALSERPGVKPIAVENFLFSLDMALPKAAHMANAIRDQKLYNWNMKTLDAITEGIELAYKAEDPRKCDLCRRGACHSPADFCPDNPPVGWPPKTSRSPETK